MSRFSRRSAFSLEENALSLARAARQSRGEPLVDLRLADPAEAGLPRPQAELPLGRVGSEPFGQAAARAVLAAHLGLPAMESSRLILSASTAEAYRWLLELLCDPGDNVVTTSPGYPLLEHLAQLEGVESRAVPLCIAGGYALDPDALESEAGARWSSSPSTRGMRRPRSRCWRQGWQSSPGISTAFRRPFWCSP